MRLPYFTYHDLQGILVEHFPHVIPENPKYAVTEVRAWCLAQFGTEARVEDTAVDTEYRWAQFSLFYWFRDEKDALLFALKWGINGRH